MSYGCKRTASFGYEPPFGDQDISANLGIVNPTALPAWRRRLIGGYNTHLIHGRLRPLPRAAKHTYQIVDMPKLGHGSHVVNSLGNCPSKLQLFGLLRQRRL